MGNLRLGLTLNKVVSIGAIPRPRVTAITPNIGDVAGATVVVITGTGFTGATGVTIGGAACTSVVVNSDTQITCNTPAGLSGAVSVEVTTPLGTSTPNTLYTYVGVPTVTSVLPTSGPVAGGDQIVIQGTNFVGVTGVTVGGAACTSVVVNSDTQITCNNPAGLAGTASILVTNIIGTNGPNTLFTYVAIPTVISVLPVSGDALGGTQIVITGTNFIGVTGVTVGGAACTSVVVDSATQITCNTPAGSGANQSILVTAVGGTNIANTLYEYLDLPTVVSVLPTSVDVGGGDQIIIQGTNFTGTTGVTVGGAACTSVVVDSDTQITCNTPAGSGANQSILVTNADGTNAANTLLDYVAIPVVDSVLPVSGDALGGTEIVITGSNLTGVTTVTVGGAACTSVVVDSDTQITCNTPAGSGINQSIIATNSFGSNDANTLYEYLDLPTVTSVLPVSGIDTGGTEIVIQGTNFTGTIGVTVGGGACTSVVVDSDTQITCNTPSGTAGAQSILVTNADGTNAANLLFTYIASNINRGLFAGGSALSVRVNTVDYIGIATTGNATDFGNLISIRQSPGGTGSDTRGVFGGGFNGTRMDVIDYFTIASTGNGSDFGNLSIGRSGVGAASNGTRAVFGGGTDSGGSTNIIDYITIASTGNALDFGDRTVSSFGNVACGSTTRGIFWGSGSDPTIDYITIASTGNATDFGDTLLSNGQSASFSNAVRGLLGGGTGNLTVMDYITIATTGNSLDFGDLSSGRSTFAGLASKVRGVWGGGQGDSNIMEYVTIASLGNTTDFGNLTEGRSNLGGLSSSHGGIA